MFADDRDMFDTKKIPETQNWKVYWEVAIMILYGQSYYKYRKPMEMSFYTSQNRNLLKPKAKFNNMNKDYNSKSKFI